MDSVNPFTEALASLLPTGASPSEASRPSKRGASSSDLQVARSRKAMKKPARSVGAGPSAFEVPKVPKHVADACNSGCLTLMPYVAKTRSLASSITEPIDESTSFSKLTSWLLDVAHSMPRIASKEMVAFVLDHRRHLLSRDLAVLANTCILTQRVVMDHLCRLCARYVQSHDALLQFILVTTSDETPMSVGVNSKLDQAAAPQRMESSSSQQLTQYTIVNASSSSTNAKTPPKLLQSGDAFAMLIMLPSGKYCNFFGDILSWYQRLERTTAECLIGAEMRRSLMLAGVEHFVDKTRVNLQDQAKGNKRQAAHNALKFNTFQQVDIDCESYIGFNIHTDTWKLVEPDISGQINLALSVNHGTGMQLMRRILRIVAKLRTRVTDVPPPVRSERFRRQLLRLCLSTGPRVLDRTMMLLSLPNGNILLKNVVEIYIPSGISYDEDKISDVVAEACVDCFTSSNFPMYPRHRMAGSDLAIGSFCLFEGFCGLATACMPIYCYLIKHTEADASDGGIEALARAYATKQAEIDRSLLSLEDEPVETEPGPPVPTSPAEALYEAQHRESVRSLSRSLSWLVAAPLDNALAIRQILEILQPLVKDQNRLGASEWEAEQLAAEVKSFERSPGATCQLHRTYPVIEAAKMTIENNFAAKFILIFSHGDLWEYLVSPRNHTRRFNCMVFRLLSRSECLVEAKLRWRHRKTSVSFFLVMVSDEDARKIEGWSACLLNPWSKHYRDKYLPLAGGLRNAELFMKLLVHCRVIVMNIIAREALHASFRRISTSKSTQTHPQAFPDTNAEFTINRFRTQHLTRYTAALEKGTEHVADGQVEASLAPKDNRVGGTWHAYMNSLAGSSNALPDTQKAASDYHQLRRSDPARFQALTDAGSDARARAHSGAGSAFGQNAQQLQRSAERQSRLELMAPVLQTMGNSNYMSTREFALMVAQTLVANKSAEDSLNTLHQAARAETRRRAITLRLQREQDNALVRTWILNKTSELVSVLTSELEAPQSLISHFLAVPFNGVLCGKLEVNIQTIRQVVQAIDGARGPSNLATLLESDWKNSKCELIQHSHEQEVMEKRKRRGRPFCWELGLCICPPVNIYVYYLRNAFLKSMKRIFKPRSAERSLAVDGYIVCELLGHRCGAANEFEKALQITLGRPGTEEARIRIFWHIGHLSLAPYQPCFRTMTLRETQCPTMEGELQLEASPKSDFDVHAFAGMPYDMTWSVVYHKLLDNEELVPDLVPAHQSITKIPGISADEWWSPKVRSRAEARIATGEDEPDETHENLDGPEEEEPSYGGSRVR